MSMVKDMSLAAHGRKKIEWVRDFMPALSGIEARFARELDEGAVYASWQAGNVFFTAHSTQLDPSAFAALVGNIIGS